MTNSSACIDVDEFVTFHADDEELLNARLEIEQNEDCLPSNVSREKDYFEQQQEWDVYSQKLPEIDHQKAKNNENTLSEKNTWDQRGWFGRMERTQLNLA